MVIKASIQYIFAAFNHILKAFHVIFGMFGTDFK
jgi:hypothetical protein